jgi:hypothetical protein
MMRGHRLKEEGREGTVLDKRRPPAPSLHLVHHHPSSTGRRDATRLIK